MPDPDPTDSSFGFETDYSDDFSLKNGESADPGDLSPGTYSVAETVPTGYVSDDASKDVVVDNTATC